MWLLYSLKLKNCLFFYLIDLQIQRLASYERYFQDLLCETGADHPDLDDVHKARDKAQEVSAFYL